MSLYLVFRACDRRNLKQSAHTGSVSDVRAGRRKCQWVLPSQLALLLFLSPHFLPVWNVGFHSLTCFWGNGWNQGGTSSASLWKHSFQSRRRDYGGIKKEGKYHTVKHFYAQDVSLESCLNMQVLKRPCATVRKQKEPLPHRSNACYILLPCEVSN